MNRPDAATKVADDQKGTVEFLAGSRAHGGKQPVERIDTHISHVFLAGDCALKLKRAVRFPYCDFSTADKRRDACRRELEINRRTAPDLYKAVAAVNRDADGQLSLDGPGEAIDWVVVMVRFDQSQLFDRLARTGGLDRTLMEDTAEAIARFHDWAAILTAAGGADAMAEVVAINRRSFAESPEGTFEAEKLDRLASDSDRWIERLSTRLDTRRARGRVRDCHGDLHLRNLVQLNGKPTLFDAIEFNEKFSQIDVIYDLAFLLMDLDHRALGDMGTVVLNRYLDIGGDDDGLAPLPLFLSLRAAIRAHVTAAAGEMAVARTYLDQALAYLTPPAPRLIAVGGLSGSGKSRLALGLAPWLGPAPGARVLRSDVLRKRLAGIPTFDRLGPQGYTSEMTARTYATLVETVRETLLNGHSAIADAVFSRPAERAGIERVAREMDVPFLGIWLDAPADVRSNRVADRRRDASDATPEVVRRQLDYDLGEIAWTRLRAAGPFEETLAAARRVAGV